MEVRSTFISGFRYLAESWRFGLVPEDRGTWEYWGPPNCTKSIEQILDEYSGSKEPLPHNVADMLGLPEGSTYGQGVVAIMRGPEATCGHVICDGVVEE